MIKVKKITLSAADIFAMAAGPKVMLPAPAVGYVNNILGVSHRQTYGTIPWNPGSNMFYGWSAAFTNDKWQDPVTLNSAVNTNVPCQKSNAGQSVYSTTEDFTLRTNAAVLAGDSSIDAYIIYETKKLE